MGLERTVFYPGRPAEVENYSDSDRIAFAKIAEMFEISFSTVVKAVSASGISTTEIFGPSGKVKARLVSISDLPLIWENLAQQISPNTGEHFHPWAATRTIDGETITFDCGKDLPSSFVYTPDVID